ncbi:MAG: sigma-70 family RNA polymerase sigma factor [Prevotella sp.]|nr:sigma-70 family RNA polymerase sigma factor [Prevotella sp.]
MKTISFQSDILPLKNELFRMALRITQNREEAEDVVQETMIKVWNRREQWAQLESIEAFCLTICRNLALDKLRRMDNQVQSLGDDIEPTDHSHSSNPEQVTIQNERTQMVRQLISELPERLRTCMQLRDIEGKSYRDIATILDITEQQVKVNIFRARQAVREQYLKIEK